MQFSPQSRFFFSQSLPLPLVCEAGGLSFLLGFLVLLAVEVDFFHHAVDGFFQDGFLQLAFPDDDDCPAFGFQLAPDFLVALLVTGDFRLPKLRVGFRDVGVLAVFVTMPETAVDEDDRTVFGKDEVRGAGETLVVNSVAEAFLPESMAQPQLRFCGSGVDGSHVAMALGGSLIIRHYIDIVISKFIIIFA